MTQILNSGTTLVVDRYAFSGVAFTAAKRVRDRSDLSLYGQSTAKLLVLQATPFTGREGF